MLCVLIGHNYVNEVQTITQLFFPGESYEFVYERVTACPTGYVIETAIENGVAVAYVVKDCTVVAEYTLPLNALPMYLSPRRVLMLALYHALQFSVGAYTPWGALTGIRPSKMVREWLDKGWAHEKIIATMQDPFCCTHEKALLALDVAIAERELTERIYNGTPVIASEAKQSRNSNIPGLLRRSTPRNDDTNQNSTGTKIVPVGIYLSIPFCPTRCVYCSFNVQHNYANPDIHAQYVAAVERECKAQSERLSQIGGAVSSIYIGGGTPTVLSEYLLEKLLDTVNAYFVGATFGRPLEYSIEAGRPDTLTKSKLDILRRYGANRIAVNPQTLNDNTLKAIGRRHTAADFFLAFNLARESGFECINTDVIAGLPGETTDDMYHTMEGIAQLSPENITVHTLAVKRASRLNETLKDYNLPTAQATEEMLGIANATCASAGLVPYYLYRQKNMVGMFENVGYSKPGHECLYNVGMMAETQTVLGIGAGAVSKFVAGDTIRREFNPKNPEVYVERAGKND